MKVKKLTVSALFIGIGVLLGNIIFIPVGVAKCFPIQHSINVITSVLLGPMYSVSIAFCISFLRNIIGTGSLLAFPGSMIGAFVAALFYKKFKCILSAAIGEVIGTGILGALLAFPITKFLLCKNVAALFFIIPFSISTIGGSVIAYVLLKVLERNNKQIFYGTINSKIK